MEKVCILGLGYIGLPTALMFAANGVRVYGMDPSESVCDTINAGGVHIVEPGLDEQARKVRELGTFSAATEPTPCESYIICVPTPVLEDKRADLSYVKAAGRAVGKVLKAGDLVILESTVPPRCTDDVLAPILEEESGLVAGRDFKLAHCPERVLPGKILYELQHNNKIIGGVTPQSAEAARDLYAAFVKGEMILTDAATAEMCKLMENTYRDVNIALADELAIICEKLGINAWEVIRLANKHPRVNLHQPGPGVGGHCLAVDPWFIVETTPDEALIINLARETNDEMPMYVCDWVADLVEAPAKVTLLGCTYKPDIDDMRESPIMVLKEALEEKGYTVAICDPYIEQYACEPEFAAKDADILVLCVDHKPFADLPLGRIAGAMKQPVLLDTKNYIDEEAAVEAGFEYHLLGRGEA